MKASIQAKKVADKAAAMASQHAARTAGPSANGNISSQHSDQQQCGKSVGNGVATSAEGGDSAHSGGAGKAGVAAQRIDAKDGRAGRVPYGERVRVGQPVRCIVDGAIGDGVVVGVDPEQRALIAATTVGKACWPRGGTAGRPLCSTLLGCESTVLSQQC